MLKVSSSNLLLPITPFFLIILFVAAHVLSIPWVYAPVEGSTKCIEWFTVWGDIPREGTLMNQNSDEGSTIEIHSSLECTAG